MAEHMINSTIGNKICRIKAVQRNVYRVTFDGVFAGLIRKESSGWMLEECAHDDLTAENVQLIGDQIDRLSARLAW